MAYEDTSITQTPRRLIAFVVTGLIGALVIFVAVWDLVVISRIAAEECRLVGRAAEERGVADGATDQPDSGGCAAYRCVDIVRTAPRIAFSDVESIRSPDC